MQKIRVLMVLGNTRRGGTQSFIMNLLRNIDRDRFQIDLAINNDFEGGWGPDMKALGCEIFIFPAFKVYNLFSFNKYWSVFFANHPYDIVHGHSTNSAGIYLKIAKQYGCKTIAHIHSTGFRGHWIERLSKRLFSKLTKKHADYWFACSNEAAQRLYGDEYKHYPRYYEIPNAIDVKRFEYNEIIRNRIRRELRIGEDGFLCGHAGTLSAPKNHLFLLEIFSEIVKRNNNARLLLIGEGIMRPTIEAKARSLGIYNRIVFRQNLPNVNEYLMSMDLFIFPSLFEGFGMASLEAQATGLNVVQSDNVPRETHLTECVVSISLKEASSIWAERALSMPKRDRKTVNLQFFDTKYNLANTIPHISKIYCEMVDN